MKHSFTSYILLASAATLSFFQTEAAQTITPQDADTQSTVELPYSESFDDKGNYDGKNVLPIGWLTTGTYPWRTASITGVKAITGTYYIVAPESDQAHNETAYTPLFDMKAGTEYTVSFYLYMPGRIYYEEQRPNSFRLTVGSEQDSEFHTNTLLSLDDAVVKEWTRQEVKFTPEQDGTYCFAFSLTTEHNWAGDVAIDDFLITAPGLILRPTADFGFNSLFNLMDSKCILFPNQPLDIVNLSQSATEYAWEAPGAEPSTSTEPTPSFTFPASGTYTIKLTAKNIKGERSTFKEVNVALYDHNLAITDEKELPIMNYNPGEDPLLQQGELPTFDTDEKYDYVAGVNHYYRKVAERFTLPDDQELTVRSASIYFQNYNLKATYSGEQKNCQAKWVIYGDKDGEVDESTIFGQKISTLGEEFGTVALNMTALMSFTPDKPIPTKGSFYVALEIDPNYSIDSNIDGIARGFLGMSPYIHHSGTTTLYVNPDNVPDGSSIETGKWVGIDKFDKKYAGYGWYMVLWTEAPEMGSVALNSDGQPVFAIRVDDNNLIVSGTKKGESLCVYGTNGTLVKKALTSDYSTELSINDLGNGIYIVSTPQGTQKFIKK